MNKNDFSFIMIYNHLGFMNKNDLGFTNLWYKKYKIIYALYSKSLLQVDLHQDSILLYVFIITLIMI